MKITTLSLAFLLLFACQPKKKLLHPPTENQGVVIDYNLAGTGDTAVVLVHGWCINKDYWQPQMAELARHHTVVALDLGGHGTSGHNRESWTVADFAKDVEAVIEALDLRKVVLVGHSMGGDIILEVARAMPSRIVGFIGIDNFKDVSDSTSPEQQRAINEFMTAIKSNYVAVASSYSSSSLFPPNYADTASLNRVINDIKKADSVMAVKAIASVIEYKEPAALSQLNIPVHLIVSDYTTTHEESLKKYCKAGYSIKVIHGTGHYPMIEKPAEFNRLLNETLQEIARQH